jgi:membrane associated rhomboid family serine protease
MKFSIILSGVILLFFLIQLAVPGFTESFLLDESSFSEPWRFVSSIFLHGDITHLLFNLFALLLFGFILEKLIGQSKFLAVFFASGIIASLVSVNFYPASLGASGAIYGLIGAITLIRPKMMILAFSIPMPMFIAAAVYIIINIVQTYLPTNTGTIAHLSGMAIGIIFGLFLRKKYAETKQIKIEVPDSYMEEWERRYMS